MPGVMVVLSSKMGDEESKGDVSFLGSLSFTSDGTFSSRIASPSFMHYRQAVMEPRVI